MPPTKPPAIMPAATSSFWPPMTPPTMAPSKAPRRVPSVRKSWASSELDEVEVKITAAAMKQMLRRYMVLLLSWRSNDTLLTTSMAPRRQKLIRSPVSAVYMADLPALSFASLRIVLVVTSKETRQLASCFVPNQCGN